MVEGSPDRMLTALEQCLRRSLDQLRSGPGAPMVDIISHHLGWSDGGHAGGKRIRPLLLLQCCQAAGGSWERALPAAVAVEWVHNFSLIHDDIQDQSALRRGRPTVWSKWGLAMALNVGDALFALSRLATQELRREEHAPQLILEVQARIDRACLDLTQGQYLDMAFETQTGVQLPEYYQMIEAKTASLIAAACYLGARLAGASKEIACHYEAYGRDLGLAFQIRDDILGIWGEPAITGKPRGDDLRARKKTLPVLFALRESPRFESAWLTPDSQDRQITELTGLLDACGAYDYAQSEEMRLTHAAIMALQKARPQGEAADWLLSLPAQLLQRDR